MLRISLEIRSFALSSQILEGKMSRACGMYGGEEMHRVLVYNLKERDCMEELSINGRIILKWILKRLNGRL